MGRHFCTCTATNCPDHPTNSETGCDDCIKKNLKLGEIPSCFWSNQVVGETKYSAVNFAKYILENRKSEG